jgi:hypothetical protein
MSRTSRRRILGALGALPFLGASSAPSSGAAPGAAPPEVPAGAGPATEEDRRTHARLRALDLDDPATVAKRQAMPAGRLRDLAMGRLICGSNLISMNMHARDLGYVRALAARYNTEERVFMTLKKCEEHGVSAVVLKDHNFRQFRLKRYWTDWGGRMKWIADLITTDIDQFAAVLETHLDLGASAAYVWGGASDTWYHQKKPGHIVKAFEMVRASGVPAGVGAHRLEPIAFCEKEGLAPDFYFLTLHHDRYWSAHPKENRRFIEMYEKDSPNHAEYHDNLFCHNADETIAFMQNVKVPWIAFKVLAAGAIPPGDGFRYAFQGGADFLCVGMFDFQVEEDARLAREAVAQAKDRKRPWLG